MSKRARTTPQTPARKRVRLSGQGDSNPPSLTPKKSKTRRSVSAQTTLTQIDFVNDRSSFRDADGHNEHTITRDFAAETGKLPGSRRRSSVKRKTVPGSLKKRESTLTQMGFFSPKDSDVGDFDSTLLKDESEHESTLRPTEPTVHGHNPYKTATLDIVSTKKRSKSAPRAPTLDAGEDRETQDYKPRKRRKTEEINVAEPLGRRRSARVASIRRSTVHSVDDQAKTDLREHPRTPVTTTAAPRKPLLEVQDSTEFVDVDAPMASKFFANHTNLLSTPTKPRSVIPSSQSPESLPPTTVRKTRSATRRSARKPLTELSTNIILSPSKSKNLQSKMKVPLFKSPPRKTSILKLHDKSSLTASRGERKRSSPQDIWSLRPTSSPQSSPRKARDKQGIDRLPQIQKNSSTASITIPETDSLQVLQENGMNKDERGIQSMKSASACPPQVEGHLSSEPNHPCDRPVESKEDLDEDMLFTHEVDGMPPVGTEIPQEDDESDFGSPVANDTQFVRDLHQRISSPLPSSDGVKTVILGVAQTTESSSVRPSSDTSHVTVPTQVLPIPRLVHTSPYRAVQRQKEKDISATALPSFSTQSISFEGIQTAKVPLNDTMEEGKSSSDPLLPPPPVPHQTQRSIHPASIPHPSQMSTQISTQGMFLQPSAPQTQRTLFPPADRITIKDSSSMPARLSQFPQHVFDEEYGSLLDVQLVDESDDHDDDLDVASMRPYRSNTKKDLGVEPGKTDYSTNIKTDEEENDATQTPTQKSHVMASTAAAKLWTSSSSQSSVFITNATTRSQRDAKLEVVPLLSSPTARSQPHVAARGKMPALKKSRSEPRRTIDPVQFDFPSSHPTSSSEHEPTPRVRKSTTTAHTSMHEIPPSSPLALSSSPMTPSPPKSLSRKYEPIPGFDNDTQSNFTQGGHVTAAYIHRRREEGDLPEWFVPKPFKVGGSSARRNKGEKK